MFLAELHETRFALVRVVIWRSSGAVAMAPVTGVPRISDGIDNSVELAGEVADVAWKLPARNRSRFGRSMGIGRRSEIIASLSSSKMIQTTRVDEGACAIGGAVGRSE